MAINPEEFKKRREARAKKRLRQKKMLRILGLAGGALLAVGIVILVIVLAGRNAPAKPQEEEKTNKTVVHIAAVGDLNVTQRLVESGGANYDYTDTFKDVLPLLANADVTLMNLEGNFYGQPYGTDRSAPQSLASAMARAGVDVVQVANSYSIYKGMDGLKKTLTALKDEGLTPLGAYATTGEAQAAKGYVIRNVQGVKIAFVAFTKGMDGMALPAGNEGCVNVLYEDYSTDYRKVDTENISRILDAAEKEKPDLTVAMLHWGSEFNDNVSQSQEDILKMLQSRGVDIVIGTHSHYVQKMVLDKEKGTFVAYSLGDFVGTERAGSEYSVVLDLEITKDLDSGKTTVTGFDYTPIFTVAEAEKPLRVVRIAETMDAYDKDYLDRITPETYDAMTYALKRIEARINGQ